MFVIAKVIIRDTFQISGVKLKRTVQQFDSQFPNDSAVSRSVRKEAATAAAIEHTELGRWMGYVFYIHNHANYIQKTHTQKKDVHKRREYLC